MSEILVIAVIQCLPFMGQTIRARGALKQSGCRTTRADATRSRVSPCGLLRRQRARESERDLMQSARSIMQTARLTGWHLRGLPVPRQCLSKVCLEALGAHEPEAPAKALQLHA